MKKACVLLAEGFEEIEALTPVDYLRRVGVEVTAIGTAGREVTGARGITVVADAGPEALAADYDAVIVPGGMPGARNLADDRAVTAFIKRHAAAGKIVAAICAGPAVVLHGACGLLAGRRFTGFPGTEGKVSGGVFTEGRVVKDGNIITSRAPGTAGEFAVEIAAALVGRKAADDLAASVLVQ